MMLILCWISIFVNFDSSCGQSPVDLHLRYASPDDFFTTRSQISLENSNADLPVVQWSSPSGCIMTKQGNYSSDVVCPSAGLHTVSMTVEQNGENITESKHIEVHYPCECYHWFMARGDARNGGNSQNMTEDGGTSEDLPILKMRVQVWIVNRQTGSDAERAGNAREPSLSSRLLSGQMGLLGQRPTVELHPQGLQSHHERVSYIGYEENLGLWKFDVHILRHHEPYLHIGSIQVLSLYGCFVRDTTVILPCERHQDHLPQRTNASESTSFTPQSANLWNGSTPRIVQDPCMAGVNLLLTSDNVSMTYDGFSTVEPFIFYTERNSTTGSAEVQAAALTRSNCLLLINGSVVVINKASLVAHTVLGSGNISRLNGRDWCSSTPNSEFQNANEAFVAWNKEEIYVFSYPYDDFKLLRPPESVLSAAVGVTEFEVEIEYVAFGTTNGTLGVAVTVSAVGLHKVVVYDYDLETDHWEDLCVRDNPWIGDAYQLLPTQSAVPGYLLSGPHVLLLCERQISVGNRYGTLTHEFHEYMLTEESTGTAKQLLSGSKGEIYMLTSKGKLFLGHLALGMRQISDITGNCSSSKFMWLDTADGLYTVTVEGSTANREAFPLGNEVLNALYPDNHCPYRAFRTSMTRAVHHLDLGGELTVWASIVYPLNHHSNDSVLQFIYNGADALVDVKVSTEMTQQQGIVQENMTVAFMALPFPGVRGSEAQVLFEIAPASTHFACPAPKSFVISVSVGCLLTNYINIEGFTTTGCDQYDRVNYTIPGCMTSRLLDAPLE